MSRSKEHGDSRQALRAAAVEVFAECGFEGARVEEIARRARVNKAMISYHFGGKRKLYATVLADHFAAVEERLRGLLGSEGSAAERLDAFFPLFQEEVSRRPQLPIILLREAISGGRRFDSRSLPRLVSVFRMLREIVESGIRDGSFRPVDPALTQIGLIGSLVFYCGTTPFRTRSGLPGFSGGADRLPEFMEHMRELMSRGLRADPLPPARAPEPRPSKESNAVRRRPARGRGRIDAAKNRA